MEGVDPDTRGTVSSTVGGILGVFWRAGGELPGIEQLG